ncbi:PSP1 C-terminal conserved region-domain-containing protein [Absidia repens]|uniref:PSP1 C-terminal conserved region-domain-containing protein n=1 Tax=Absidia repens TaxID=90262 RepID=A0A1X2IWU8_9FUNG|nr:PSP1 C-terminal conserved region-domain-containing protein [Absidia repens]
MQLNDYPSTFKKIGKHGTGGIPDVDATSLDEAWKAVGTPSRRSSLAPTSFNSSNLNNTSNPAFNNQSPAVSPTPNSLSLPGVRRSSVDQSQWGSFGRFHWEGVGIFDNETRKNSLSHSAQVIEQPSPPPPLAPSEVLVNDASYTTHQQRRFSYNNNILSVPMLPSVSMEPVYRQQRSLSFSVGQDPTLFGYDDYGDTSGSGVSNENNQGAISLGYKNLLATMEEEDQDDNDDDEDDDEADNDTLQDMNDVDTAGIAAQWRARSQSSGAAFGLLSPAQQAALLNRQLRRGSEQYEDLSHQRRHSRYFSDIQEPVTTAATSNIGVAPSQPGYPPLSIGDKERLGLLHRRLSQSQGEEYKFPDQSYNILHQRRQSVNQPPPHPQHIQQLSDQMNSVTLHIPEAEYDLSRTESTDTIGQQSRMTHGYPLQQHQQQKQTFQHAQHFQVNQHHEVYFNAEHQQQQRQKRQHQHQQSISHAPSDIFYSSDNKGIPLQRLPQNTTLYSVEFKAGRIDYFYVICEYGTNATGKFQIGDLVIVEGDRGKDLGKIASGTLNVGNVEQFLNSGKQLKDDGSSNEHDDNDKSKDDEMQALALCQQKVKLRNLPMSVVDAEYQWDRRKLTFLFVANRRIDFRELVRELFKIYKTRIWMRAVSASTLNILSSPSDTFPSIGL